MSSANQSPQEILATKPWADFISTAQAFCSLIESPQSDDRKSFLQAMQQCLLELYTLGLALPLIHLSDSAYSNEEPKEIDTRSVLSSIAEKVPFSYYWTTLNPTELSKEAEIGMGDLIDDLADIYKDLKEALLLLDQEEPAAKEAAIWQFTFDYQHHWGRHCIEILRAIHHYLSENR